MSRETILRRLRTARLAGSEDAAASARTAAERLAHPPDHPRPAFARTEGPEREARLIRCLESQGTDVIAIDQLTALPSAIEAIFEGGDPAPRLVIGDDARLTALRWTNKIAPQLWRPDQTLGDGTAALTHAWAAVAETGTLVMMSSAASPGSLAFLPELHIVALARKDIAASFEEAFARLAVHIGPHRFPRAVNLISSPSRTSDIGGRSVRGAHGPRRLAVILYGNSVEAAG